MAAGLIKYKGFERRPPALQPYWPVSCLFSAIFSAIFSAFSFSLSLVWGVYLRALPYSGMFHGGITVGDKERKWLV